MSGKKLSIEQDTFCLKYVEYAGDRARAYMEAYPDSKKRSADTSAGRLLKNVDVLARIEELRKPVIEKSLVDTAYVVAGLKDVAERCLQREAVMEFDYEEKKMKQATAFVDGKEVGIWTFDSSGANKAFELLGKHLGIFEKDNTQASTKIVVSLKKKTDGD